MLTCVPVVVRNRDNLIVNVFSIAYWNAVSTRHYLVSIFLTRLPEYSLMEIFQKRCRVLRVRLSFGQRSFRTSNGLRDREGKKPKQFNLPVVVHVLPNFSVFPVRRRIDPVRTLFVARLPFPGLVGPISVQHLSVPDVKIFTEVNREHVACRSVVVRGHCEVANDVFF